MTTIPPARGSAPRQSRLSRPAAYRTLAVTVITLSLVYGTWYAYTVFLVALLRDFGWSRSALAGAFSVFTLVAVYVLGMASMLAGIGVFLGMAASPTPWLPYAYAVLFGAGYSVTASLMPAMVSDRFRGRHFGSIFGVTQIGGAAGSALGAWQAGHLFYRQRFGLGADGPYLHMDLETPRLGFTEMAQGMGVTGLRGQPRRRPPRRAGGSAPSEPSLPARRGRGGTRLAA